MISMISMIIITTLCSPACVSVHPLRLPPQIHNCWKVRISLCQLKSGTLYVTKHTILHEDIWRWTKPDIPVLDAPLNIRSSFIQNILVNMSSHGQKMTYLSLTPPSSSSEELRSLKGGRLGASRISLTCKIVKPQPFRQQN